MIKDPIVREVREVRHEIERECKGDAEAFYEWLIASQQKYRDRLVRRQPRPAVAETQKKVGQGDV